MTETQCLKSVDVLVACKLLSKEEDRREWTYANLSRELGISQGTLHAAVMRCIKAQLLTTTGLKIHRRRLVDLLTVAAPLVFFPVRGGIARGTVTAVVKIEEAPRLPFVWPGPGNVQGAAISPIYPTAPLACQTDPRLYDLLALLDVIRVGGSASESERAANSISKKVMEKKS